MPAQEHEFTIKDLADHRGVSTKTVRRWLKDQGLKHFRIGHVIRIKQSHLDEFDRQHTVR